MVLHGTEKVIEQNQAVFTFCELARLYRLGPRANVSSTDTGHVRNRSGEAQLTVTQLPKARTFQMEHAAHAFSSSAALLCPRQLLPIVSLVSSWSKPQLISGDLSLDERYEEWRRGVDF